MEARPNNRGGIGEAGYYLSGREVRAVRRALSLAIGVTEALDAPDIRPSERERLRLEVQEYDVLVSALRGHNGG